MRNLLVLVLLALVSRSRAWDQEDRVNVTCGSTIKLRNEGTLRHLHSMEIQYGSGSGQQAVLGTSAGDSVESLWIIRDAGSTASCRQGTPIRSGFKIRLQHSTTGKWLHSHLHKSPLSGNQEVSCFGSSAQSDTGDVWVVEFDSGKDSPYWERDMRVNLKHMDTGAYLGSHKKEYGRPIAGYGEIYAAKGNGKGKEHKFMATDGVYF